MLAFKLQLHHFHSGDELAVRATHLLWMPCFVTSVGTGSLGPWQREEKGRGADDLRAGLGCQSSLSP